MIRNIEKFDLSNVFPPLLQLEKRKRYIIENCQLPSRAFTFEEAANEKTIDFVMKSPDIIFDSFGWEAMTQIATTDYLKKLSFSKMMTSADLKAFLKSSYLDCILLSTAMHYYSLNCEKIYFPGGIDVFPKEMELVLNFKPELDSRIKSRLIGRLAELKITNEEFLLLNMIFICNPSVLHISKTGGLLLANFQQIYSDLLLKYCQMTYQQHAPTRFTDLLSLCHVMALTKKDICNAILLLQFYEPGVEGKVIIKSAVRHMLKH
uniref:NR LBD domain-containing protein n=1 Tax=Caenorhabditis tropicalis TaxID=1561998 RepID=A0A1I7UEP4_9PELO